jgi:hypothetical protein
MIDHDLERENDANEERQVDGEYEAADVGPPEHRRAGRQSASPSHDGVNADEDDIEGQRELNDAGQRRGE